MARLGLVMALPSKIIQMVKDEYDDMDGVWHLWEAQLNNAFSVQNLNAAWNTFIDYIDANSMAMLQMTVGLLASKSTGRPIDASSIESIRARLQEDYEAALALEQNDDVKKYLVRSLREIIANLDEYRLTGAAPILRNSESIIGHMEQDNRFNSFMSETSLGQRIKETLGMVSDIVTIVTANPQLVQAAVTLALPAP
jgi:hypothetical protein